LLDRDVGSYADVLAGLLPGLRELRAPLAAGYLWLLLLWLAFGDEFPSAGEVHPGPVERLYQLEPVISSLGLAVVASVGAYVVGSIAVDMTVAIGRFFSSGLSKVGLGDYGLDRADAERREMAKVRLLDESAALHAEVDRPDSEASFRLALWPPTLALVIYASASIDPLWIFGLVLPLALAVQWLVLRRRANAALRVAAAARPSISQPPPDAGQAPLW
jgi:hypothetical protein